MDILQIEENNLIKFSLYENNSATYYSGEKEIIIAVKGGQGGLTINGDSYKIMNGEYFLISKNIVFTLTNINKEELTFTLRAKKPLYNI